MCYAPSGAFRKICEIRRRYSFMTIRRILYPPSANAIHPALRIEPTVFLAELLDEKR